MGCIAGYKIFKPLKEKKMADLRNNLWNQFLPLIQKIKFLDVKEKVYRTCCKLKNDYAVVVELSNKNNRNHLQLIVKNSNNGIIDEFIDIQNRSIYPTAFLKDNSRMKENFLALFKSIIIELSHEM
ncbi:hypothetical protein D4R87_01205 [bacterium]|nr:MAG: hypothetical protein D4R87_01205 [bacterium]